MPRQCEAMSPGVNVRCRLNAGHSGAHAAGHDASVHDITWSDEHERIGWAPAATDADGSQLREQLEIMVAKRDAYRQALTAAVAYIERAGGFMWHEDQVALAHWRALLDETKQKGVG